MVNDEWRFYSSHQVKYLGLSFDSFATREADELTIDDDNGFGYALHGILDPRGPKLGNDTARLLTSFFAPIALTTGGLTMTWTSSAPKWADCDPSVDGMLCEDNFRALSSRNWSTKYAVVMCDGPDGVANTINALPLNDSVEIASLGPMDDTYFALTLPANRELFLVVDTVFSLTNGEASPTAATIIVAEGTGVIPSFGGGPGSTIQLPSGAVRHVPRSGSERPLTIRVHSTGLAGRIRMTAVSPLVVYTSDGGDQVQVGFEGDKSNLEVRDIANWGSFQASLIAATSGQFMISGQTEFEDNSDLWSAMDLVITDAPTAHAGADPDACTLASADPVGYSWFGYIRIGKDAWEGASWNDGVVDCPPIETSFEVGTLLVHEWGHYGFGAPDEYQPTTSKCGCNQSVMCARAKESAVTNIGFCDSKNHNLTGLDFSGEPATSSWEAARTQWPALEKFPGEFSSRDPALLISLQRAYQNGDFWTRVENL